MIDGVKVKSPTDLKVGRFILSKSERTASGKMVMEIIAKKRRLDCKWSIIKGSELKTILDLLDSKTFHQVTYPDPQTGENTTITCYVGDINMTVFQPINTDRYYTDVSIALIEQ